MVVIGLNVIWIVGMTVTEDSIATPVAATLLVVGLPLPTVHLVGKLLPHVERNAMVDEEGATVDPQSVVHQEEEATGTGAVVPKEVTEEEIETVMIETIGMTGMTGTI